MSASATSLPKKRPFGCGYIVFPLLLLIFGLTSVFVARQLAPQTSTDAQVFRSDLSCGADLNATTSAGACRTVDAEVLVAEMRKSGFARTPVRTPFVALRFADGTFHEAQLDGSGGEVFTDFVKPGAPARVQLFRGTIVRVVSGKDLAVTTDAPSVDAEMVTEMPWVGGIVIALALVIVGLRIATLRR
jgi:hypothetical protein